MSNIDPKKIDIESREKIIKDIDKNFFVEAGAGSGKTTVLVERMVAMVEKGLDISKISAITFTKAAANEFYSRFQKRLIERSSIKSETEFKKQPGKIDYPSTEKTRGLCQRALQNIDLAFMGTIDSFCNTVMSEHPMEGKIPSSSSVISDEEQEYLFRNEYARICKGEYEDINLLVKADTYGKYTDDYSRVNAFISTMNILLNHRDVDIVLPNVKLENIDDKYEEEIKAIRHIFKVITKKGNEDYVRSTNSNIEDLKKNIKQYSKVIEDSWDENASEITSALKNTILYGYKADKDKDGNKKITSNFRLANDDLVVKDLGYVIDYFIENPGRDKYLIPNPDKFPKMLEDIKNMQYYACLDFCVSARDAILKELRKQGKLSFADYLIYLRDMLKEDIDKGGKLIKHIYERHSYFLIDEFQDTDPIQAEIFFYLSAQKLDSDWRKCIPYQGSLFIVGDPKQSIYRFKNADVGAYLSVEELFKDPEVGEVLYLFSNFRSSNLLKEFFNTTFNKMLVSSDEQAPFVDIPVESSCDISSSKVYSYGTPYNQKDEDDFKLADEVQVPEIVLKLVNNQNYKIYDNELGKDRCLDYKDIMLITPTKTKLKNYTKAFRQKGIPYYIEGAIDFKESLALKELTSIYGSITQNQDNRYLYGALKTSILHIKEKDIIEAINSGYVFNVFKYSKDLSLSKELDKTLSKLYELALLANSYNPSSLFLKLIEELDVFKYTGSSNLEYIYFVLELLKNKELSNEIVSHLDALNYLQGLLKGEIKEERCPGLNSFSNQVHIANLHKVKGLEAPVVILCAPRVKPIDPSFRTDRVNHKGYLFSVSNENGYKYFETKDFEKEKEKEKVSEKAEKLRKEYVAATRARNILIIAQVDTSKPSDSLDGWVDLRIQDNQTFNDYTEVKLQKINVKQKENDISYSEVVINEGILNTNSKDISINTYSSIRPSSLTSNNEITDSELNDITVNQLDEFNHDTLSTIKGTMVHRLMELIINSKDKCNSTNLINQVVNEYITSEFIGKKTEFINMLNTVYDTLHNGGYKQIYGAEDDILHLLLSADEVYTEMPFTYKEDNNIYNGIIDLIYKKENKYHIIDWKTNKLDEGLDKHYENQLNIYKKAFEASTGLNVEDAKIYHIDINTK